MKGCLGLVLLAIVGLPVTLVVTWLAGHHLHSFIAAGFAGGVCLLVMFLIGEAIGDL